MCHTTCISITETTMTIQGDNRSICHSIFQNIVKLQQTQSTDTCKLPSWSSSCREASLNMTDFVVVTCLVMCAFMRSYMPGPRSTLHASYAAIMRFWTTGVITRLTSLCFSTISSFTRPILAESCNHTHTSVIFVTKIKTRTRIIGRRFQRTRTRIIVIQKTKTK